MYVLENVRDFVQLHNLQAGSTLSFYYAPDTRLVIHPVLLLCSTLSFYYAPNTRLVTRPCQALTSVSITEYRRHIWKPYAILT